MKTRILPKTNKKVNKSKVTVTPKVTLPKVLPKNCAEFRGRRWYKVNTEKVFSPVFNSRSTPFKINPDFLNRVFGPLNEDGSNSIILGKEKKVKKVKEEKIPGAPPKPRGRKPSNFKAIFPKGKWTIEDAATLNKVEKHTITNFMNKATKEKTMKFECVGEKRKDGQRGKASKIYKVIK